MKKELEKKLAEDFPAPFRDLRGDPSKTCMAFGCDVGDGWEPLLRRLCEGLRAAGLEERFLFLQIKEKWGLLRIYWDIGDAEGAPVGNAGYDSAEGLVNEAEEESQKVCEECGSREGVTTEGGWLRTLCSRCRGLGGAG